MIEEDHIGIGFVNKGGTLYTGYDNPVKQHYTYFMYHLYNDTNNVTDKVTPLTWYLCCQWSLDNPFENKLCFSRPNKYEETYFVYYIDSDTAGYFDERYSAEALEWTDYYNVTLFLVNLGEKPIDSSLLEFAEKNWWRSSIH